MDELIFAGNKYISSKRAGKLTGYTTDYIGQMCRGNKIDCRLIGRNWYINEDVINNQKKSFKKEQLGENKKEIQYSKIKLEPIYYSNDERTNNIEIDKIVQKEQEDEDTVEVRKVPERITEQKEDLISVLRMVESSMIDLRSSNRKLIKRPTRKIAIPIKKKVLLPKKSSIRLPIVRTIAFALVLLGLVFVASTFILEKSVHYTSSDKGISTEYQLASIKSYFSF